jgi:hypothetical protein
MARNPFYKQQTLLGKREGGGFWGNFKLKPQCLNYSTKTVLIYSINYINILFYIHLYVLLFFREIINMNLCVITYAAQLFCH